MCSTTFCDKLALGAVTTLSLAMLGSSYVVWRRLQERAVTGAPLDAWSLERLTGLTLGLLGAAIIAWLLLCVAIAALAHLLISAGDRLGAAAASLVPGFIGRLVIAGLGGSLALAGCALGAAPAGAAVSAAAPLSPPKSAPRPMAELKGPGVIPNPARAGEPNHPNPELLSPGFIPHRVPLPLPRLVGATTRSSSEVVVQRGDSLWAIAARHLPGDAGIEEIASAWPHWYHANWKLIGPDPDLLEVGMVLQKPEPSTPKP
ncbi:LysM peptidoglycan-binding domain-containing protein [Paeniglutamicibacter antarcticus]|uniref:LysM domain-containing protein n=1 Tax=Paeniglutamicibacter antarcticus TaxID=494023 RepID=A0ABP9TNR9_9MICC